MKTTLDMKTIQNMNLFERITGVKTRCCFDYGLIRYFVVPRFFLRKALGENTRNLAILERGIGKKTRIIAEPEKKNQEEIERFIKIIIFPHEIKGVEVTMNESKEPEVQIYSIPRTKAILIGRNKARLEEISVIIDQFFGIKKVVIK